jgi:hypothetical protein
MRAGAGRAGPLLKGGALAVSRRKYERRWLGRRSLITALALGVAALAAPVASSQESPDPIPDPMTTNIPYTAWAGTQLRLVKCSDSFNREDLDSSGLSVTVESWSGADNHRPQVITSTIDYVWDNERYQRCARLNVVSLGEGIARIKLKVIDKDRNEVLEHQFLAIWMRLGTPAIDEVGAADPTGGPVGSRTEVGDPLGDGNFLPSSKDGRVQVTVTGSFPDETGAIRTLPNDWAALAASLATDRDPTNEDPASRWDIHDDTLKTEGHVAGFCNPVIPQPIDAVDNCQGGLWFSRFFGDSVFDPVGPFDPVRTDTLLTDGKLDAGDAPMPAARVDIKIAPNTNSLTDIGGAGALEKADKTEVYSRDGNGTASPHNLYAPFYGQYVPATAGGDSASGTDWNEQNNFGLNYVGSYDNWDTIPLKTAVATDTDCNRTVAFPGGSYYDDPRETPSGDQTVAVFTDEHGEAQVEYEPFAGGFYYDAVGAILNDNRGCDLQDVDVLGRSVISATAKYPGQPVGFPAMNSASLTKTVGNEFDKSLSYYPKGAGTANANARILVAHGQDVDGEPFAGERVCFYVDDEADSYRLFSGTTGPAGARFDVQTEQAQTPSLIHPDVRCAFLDRNGNAALEVFNSDPQSINVIAEYVDEGLLRDRDVEFGTPGSGDPTPPPNTPPANGGTPVTGGSNGPGTTPPTTQQAIQTMGTQAAQHVLGAAAGAKANASNSARISKARIKKTKSGRWLVVRVNSSNATERLSIKLVGKSGKTLKKATKTVKTNRSVKVMKVSSRVKTAKVSLAK